MPTYQIYTTPTNDGHTVSSDAAYANARGTAGAKVYNNSAGYQAGAGVGQELLSGVYYCVEALLRFDTSVIPDTEVVLSATLRLYLSGSAVAMDVEARNANLGPTLGTEDWIQGSNVGFYTLVGSAAMVAGAAQGFKTIPTSANFVSIISKTGNTDLFLNTSRFRLGTAPAAGTNERLALIFADYGMQDFIPRLTVVTQAAPVTPEPVAQRSQITIRENGTLALLGLLDNFITAEWSRPLRGVGDFRLTTAGSARNADKLIEGRVVTIDGHPYLIQKVERSTVADELLVSGPSAKHLLATRIVVPPAGSSHDVFTGALETTMHHYVRSQAHDQVVDPDRAIANLTRATDLARGASIRAEGRFQNLVDLLDRLALAQDYGWEVMIDESTPALVFRVIVGVDRTTGTGKVIFDVEFESLSEMRWLVDSSERFTWALVAGQGEGVERQVVTRPVAEPTSWDRIEAYIDARDVEQGTDGTVELTNRGDALLADAPKDAFEADVNTQGRFRYRTHWDVGDLVLIRQQAWDPALPKAGKAMRVVDVRGKFPAGQAVPVYTALLGKPWPTGAIGNTTRSAARGESAAGAVDYASLKLETWTTLTLLNGWVIFEAATPPKYMKDPLGFVHLKGNVKDGAISTVLGNVPVGYRPAERIRVVVSSNLVNEGNVIIEANGNITPVAGFAGHVSLDNISYLAV